MTRKTQLAGYLILLLGLLAAIESGMYLITRFVVAERASFLFYQPPHISLEQWQEYLATSDPVLGWPTEKALASGEYDSAGARVAPEFPEPGNECISLYGDSFVFGADVEAKAAWGNVLSKLVGCRVANYGVSGYGTDQALLRFEHNTNDKAPISILGIYPQDLLRNVTQYRYLLGNKNVLTFKPRFLLQDGELALVAKPDIVYEQLGLLASDPGKVLPHETFVPGGEQGPASHKFPYTWGILCPLLFNERLRARMQGKPSWKMYVEPNHPSYAMEITAKIAERFMENCHARNKSCFVLLFTSRSGYNYWRENSHSIQQYLMQDMKRLGVPVLILTPAFMDYLGQREYSELVLPGGHLTPEGNKVVAEAVFAYLREHGLIPK